MKLSVAALFCVNLALSNAIIDFQNNEYRNVIVSIHPDVPEDNGQEIIDNIKEFISQGSNELYTALEKYGYIESVTILLPKTWNKHYGGSVSSDYFYEDGDIRVNLHNPVYLDTPYTLQPRGCGDRGEFIHLTPEFLIHLNDSSADTFGPMEKIFVHEWAKLRYGVFEEYGFPGDDQYPLFFYAQDFTDDGIVNDLQPNFCTDEVLSGSRQDIITGGSCNFDPQTNLPDENCVFIPSGDNSKIRSSYMATPFLESVDHFCKNTEVQYHHDIYKPTKHNAMCNYKSVWEVIMENSDFDSVNPMKDESPPPTKFNIVYPEQSGRFVLVSDRSGSMDKNERMAKLKQSAIRWLQYDVVEGTKIGLTSFNDAASAEKPLTSITNTNRQEFINAINVLRPNGGTCLGTGLMKGMDVLNGVNDESQGGAIIFITDGEQSCNKCQTCDIEKDGFVANRVKRTKVRIITVAFGKNSDDRLESLAEISGGKTYFVKDGSGLEDINGVFEESNTYQPAVPSSEAEIIIVQDTNKDVKADIRDFFIIDQTLGRDVKFTLDALPASSGIRKVTLYFQNDTELFSFTKIENTLSHTFPSLEPGIYQYEVDVNSQIDYLLVTITSKAPSNQTLPYRTKCWASTDGFEEIDAQVTKLAVFAQVEQGNRPVLHANVEAYVERENQAAPIIVDLFDNGGGSDQIANDGIYSRYFTRYDGYNGRYTLRCQVKGTDDTMFVTQKNGAKSVSDVPSGRSYPLKPSTSTSPVCCGSSIGDNIETEPTGNFTRQSNGNSFKVTNAPDKDKDFFPPSKVSNLKVTLGTQVLIEFTAPGDDYDYGNATRYEFKYSQDYDKIMNATFDWDAQKDILNITDDDLIGDDATLTPGIGGEQESIFINPDLFEEGNVYYLAMKAFDDEDQASPMSNIVRIVKISMDDGGLSGGQIAGIVIGCLLGGMVIGFIGYFVYAKFMK